MLRSSWNINGTFHIQIAGVWTASTVAAHLKQVKQQSLLISECALHFAESNPGAQICTEFDVSRITALDASGMRILKLWLDQLQMRGFNPRVINQSGELRRRFIGNKYASGESS